MQTKGQSLQERLLAVLNEELRTTCEPLFSALPLDEAMPSLLPKRAAAEEHCRLAADAVVSDAVRARQELAAGIWLYVDDLERSHEVSQGIASASGSFWHAIMHRREGDFGNSKYWLRRAAPHPAVKGLPGYDPYGFVDQVQASGGDDPLHLLQMQREEWMALFAWSAKGVGGEL